MHSLPGGAITTFRGKFGPNFFSTLEGARGCTGVHWVHPWLRLWTDLRIVDVYFQIWLSSEHDMWKSLVDWRSVTCTLAVNTLASASGRDSG